jgi:polyketide cyclase/dehydrase/lipid transport protein
MSFLRSSPRLWIAGIILIGIPCALLFIEPEASAFSTPQRIAFKLVGAAIGIPSMVFLGMGLVMGLARRSRSWRVGDAEREQKFTALGFGLGAVCLTLFLMPSYAAVAIIYPFVVLAYVLWCLPSRRRRVDFEVRITALCTADKAFGLVSDPLNWPLYFPEMEVEPPRTPVGVGSILSVRIREGRGVLQAQEKVIAFEPPRQFGTAVVGASGEGAYEFKDADGATEIIYRSHHMLTIEQSILGGALNREVLVARLVAFRTAGIERVRRLLEAEPAPPRIISGLP